nr:MAG TPA: hypothetical protein [Caudoviricetes sp.]
MVFCYCWPLSFVFCSILFTFAGRLSRNTLKTTFTIIYQIEDGGKVINQVSI